MPTIDIVQSKTTPSAPIATPTSDTERNRQGPDWDHVPFEVGCARCGTDLRGLTEPICPQCSLHFDWCDAVPLERLTCSQCDYHLFGLTETRCPECGTDFTWDGALDDYQRRQKRLFEYRTRDTPFRSAIRTWRWCLWPPKLWSEIDIHDPPQAGPLIGWVFLCLACFGIGLALLTSFDAWFYNYYWVRGARGSLASQLSPAVITWYLASGFTSIELYMTVMEAGVWAACCFGALLVYRESMFNCKVRTAHVLRVWAYATTPMLLLTATAVFVFSYVDIFVTGPSPSSVETVIILLLLAHVTWSTACGYRKYLRMPHSLPVAFSSQIIAVLAAALTFDVLFQKGFAASLIIEVAELFGGL